jgi:hypothetical protein
VKPEHVTEIVLPLGAGTLRVEDYGEHHMGASHVEIVVPFAIAGVTRFFSTNGRAYYSPATESVVIHDACLVVRHGLRSGQVQSMEHPSAWYFNPIKEDETGYCMSLYDNASRRTERHVLFDSEQFESGLGTAKTGVFPSAHTPWVMERRAELASTG